MEPQFPMSTIGGAAKNQGAPFFRPRSPWRCRPCPAGLCEARTHMGGGGRVASRACPDEWARATNASAPFRSKVAGRTGSSPWAPRSGYGRQLRRSLRKLCARATRTALSGVDAVACGRANPPTEAWRGFYGHSDDGLCVPERGRQACTRCGTVPDPPAFPTSPFRTLPIARGFPGAARTRRASRTAVFYASPRSTASAPRDPPPGRSRSPGRSSIRWSHRAYWRRCRTPPHPARNPAVLPS